MLKAKLKSLMIIATVLGGFASANASNPVVQIEGIEADSHYIAMEWLYDLCGRYTEAMGDCAVTKQEGTPTILSMEILAGRILTCFSSTTESETNCSIRDIPQRPQD